MIKVHDSDSINIQPGERSNQRMNMSDELFENKSMSSEGNKMKKNPLLGSHSRYLSRGSDLDEPQGTNRTLFISESKINYDRHSMMPQRVRSKDRDIFRQLNDQVMVLKERVNRKVKFYLVRDDRDINTMKAIEEEERNRVASLNTSRNSGGNDGGFDTGKFSKSVGAAEEKHSRNQSYSS